MSNFYIIIIIFLLCSLPLLAAPQKKQEIIIDYTILEDISNDMLQSSSQLTEKNNWFAQMKIWFTAHPWWQQLKKIVNTKLTYSQQQQLNHFANYIRWIVNILFISLIVLSSYLLIKHRWHKRKNQLLKQKIHINHDRKKSIEFLSPPINLSYNAKIKWLIDQLLILLQANQFIPNYPGLTCGECLTHLEENSPVLCKTLSPIVHQLEAALYGTTQLNNQTLQLYEKKISQLQLL